MTIMAVACGVFVVLLGVLNAGRAPSDAQSAIEVTCLVGGLILCFLGIVLSRLRAIDQRLDAFEAAAAPAENAPGPRADARRPDIRSVAFSDGTDA